VLKREVENRMFVFNSLRNRSNRAEEYVLGGKGMNYKNRKDIKEKYRSKVENRILKRNTRMAKKKTVKVNHRIERVLGVRIKSFVGDELMGILVQNLDPLSVRKRTLSKKRKEIRLPIIFEV